MMIFKGLLVAGLLSASVLWSAPSSAGVAEGKKAFVANKCAGCHQVEGPAREKTIKDQMGKKGPELWYAGSKFKAGFLEKWLAAPQPVRPLAYNSLTEKNRGDHPRLSPKDASEVASYLMSLKSAEVKPLGIPAAESPRGRITFLKKQSCYGCHSMRVRGKMAGGLSGPSFVAASERLNPDWVYAYLKNPKAFKPVKMMPVYSGILNEAEMKELASYIGSLN
jgi:mono/diheme cytochrome c family protein